MSTPWGFPPAVDGVHYTGSPEEFIELASLKTELLVLGMHGWAWEPDAPPRLGITHNDADIRFSDLTLNCRFLVLIACHQQDARNEKLEPESARTRAIQWSKISGAERIVANASGAWIQPSTVAARRVWEDEACWSNNDQILRTYLGNKPRRLSAGMPYAWDKSALLHESASSVSS